MLSYQVMVWFWCCISGTLAGNVTDFEHTTLGNLDPDSNFLWAHISLAFFLFPLSILFMRRFSVDLRFTQLSLEMSRTLLIENVPKNLCRSTEEVKRYFMVMFQSFLAYLVTKSKLLHRTIFHENSSLCIVEDSKAYKKKSYYHPHHVVL